MRKCKVEKCNNKHSALGFCNIHYQRAIRDIPLSGRKKKSIKDRILEKIKKNENGCWLWMGAKSGGNASGKYRYGYIRLGNKSKRVHRVLYEITRKEKIGVRHVLHKCDTPSCVNPDHLFLGSAYDNVRDMIYKNRDYHPCGEKNNSKLTETQVNLIRLKFLGGNVTYAELSRIYMVSPVTIRNIVLRKKWKHLP